MLRVAINGYGRIGRSLLRAVYESSATEAIKIVAINELSDSSTIAHLTRYDSTHGRFPGSVRSDGLKLYINEDEIQLFAEILVERLPWEQLEIDAVLECSGTFSDRNTAEGHLSSGAKKVLFSQPAEADVDATIVFGVNHHMLRKEQTIVSNASCTTNAVVPVIKLLDDNYGVKSGVITTIHSAMNDQPVIDAYHHTDLRKTRAAMQSIIPVETGLALGIDRLLPHLSGRFEAQAMRVPVLNVSVIDLSVVVNKQLDVKAVNYCFREASANALLGILGYTEEPLASCDFNHDSRSGIIDANQTRVAQGNLLKVLIWFDNEWGYANRMIDTLLTWYSLPVYSCRSDFEVN
ncbi:MAG: type I glyceraldehyde-3-phosphate dehydrogenase [Porticoccaceae bacterium]|nr:type I glyceraldehyde-3-phosphate dehydrogenase [Porticoccaceae bacterium]